VKLLRHTDNDEQGTVAIELRPAVLAKRIPNSSTRSAVPLEGGPVGENPIAETLQRVQVYPHKVPQSALLSGLRVLFRFRNGIVARNQYVRLIAALVIAVDVERSIAHHRSVLVGV
jgi:hypothetical protein